MQNNGKGKTKKHAVRTNLLLLIKRKVPHVQFVFMLIRSISVEAIFIVVSV